MVICGSDPNLRCEREALAFFLVVPTPILSIALPVRFPAFLTTRATGARLAIRLTHARHKQKPDVLVPEFKPRAHRDDWYDDEDHMPK